MGVVRGVVCVDVVCGEVVSGVWPVGGMGMTSGSQVRFVWRNTVSVKSIGLLLLPFRSVSSQLKLHHALG